MLTKRNAKAQTADKIEKSAAKPGFWRDEDGSFIIFGLAVFAIMLMAGGIAVDTMRYEAHRVHVQQTLDRAVLAAASLDQPLDAEDVVIDYFAKAGLGHLVNEDDLTIVEDAYSRYVEADLDMSIATTFLRLGTIDSFDMYTTGAAEEALSLVEISMVLDVSGSMGNSSSSGYSKNYELRRAAKRFVNIMMCNPSDPDETEDCTIETGNISISVVPYAEQVLLGDDLLAYFNHTAEHSESNCITFYDGDFAGISVPAYAPSVFTEYGRPLPDTYPDPIQLTGYFDPYRSAYSAPDPEDYSPCYNDYSGSSTDEWREIYPWGGDAAALRDMIDDLGASGNTSIDLGMKWGAALLDPATQPALADMIGDDERTDDFDGRPYEYTKRGIEKVIVLMTDGANTSQDYLKQGYHGGLSGVWKANDTDDWSVYSPDRDEYYWVEEGEWRDAPFGAGEEEECSWVDALNTGPASRVPGPNAKAKKGGKKKGGGKDHDHDDDDDDDDEEEEPEQEWVCEMVPEGSGATELTFPELWLEKTADWYNDLPSSYFENASDYFGNSEKDDYLEEICTAAKDAGIVVFTIGFEVNNSQDDIMRDCASADSYYFDVDGLDISAAFAAIAREISKLRLVF